MTPQENNSMEERLIRYMEDLNDRWSGFEPEYYQLLTDFIKHEIRLVEQSLVGRVKSEIKNTPTFYMKRQAISTASLEQVVFKQDILSLPLLLTIPDGDNQ